MAATYGMPRWQSHKTVHAARILTVNGDNMTLQGDGHEIMITAAPNMFSRYRPVPGDYYVVYDDGYASISPKQAFETGYHRF